MIMHPDDTRCQNSICIQSKNTIFAFTQRKKITKTIGGYLVSLYVEVFEARGAKHSCFGMVMLTGEKQCLSQSLLTAVKMCQALV